MNDLITVSTDPTRPDWARLALRGRITIGCATELHRAALGLVAQVTNVTIDCTAVEYLDVAGIQLLLCLERDLGRAGRRGALAGVPEALAADFRLLGLGAAPPAAAPRPPAPKSRWEEAIRAVIA